MDWSSVERDFDIMKEAGFNTVTVWCTNFHNCGEPAYSMGGRLTLKEMAKLAETAEKRNMFIQYYLNIDRFTNLFVHATLPDGNKTIFRHRLFDPDYREFCRNYAKRIAMTLYPYDNVSTICVWEEKSLSISQRKRIKWLSRYSTGLKQAGCYEGIPAKTLFEFIKLNKEWGAKYGSYEGAIDTTLNEYQKGVLIPTTGSSMYWNSDN